MTQSLSSNMIKATRKDHTCEGCFTIIPKGTSCTKYACIYEDNFYSGHICNICNAFISSAMFTSTEGWELGTLPEYTHYEAFKKSYNESLQRLTGSRNTNS